MSFRLKLILIQCICCTFFVSGIHAQSVDIEGKLKVSVMDTVDVGDTLVLRKSDGTLVTRRVADVFEDVSIDQKIVEYFVGLPSGVSALLDVGESLENLYAAGASLDTFLALGVTLEEILASEIPIDSILSELDLTIDSLLVLYNPYQLYGYGVLLDSLYGKDYTEGYIFYVDTADIFPFDGLVCGTADLGTDANWGCSDMSVSTDTILGSDPTNQSNILAAGCTDSPEAAMLCADYDSGVYNDWILPSKETLDLIYQNLQLNGLGNMTSGKSYCSSSEGSTMDVVWVQDFPSGTQSEGPKSMNLWAVRPVRAFHD